jgi:hypothetical protein
LKKQLDNPKVNRNFELEKVATLSGKAATCYTIKFFDQKINELEDFVTAYSKDYREEVGEILVTLEQIGFTFGARDHFFKEWEGKPGDGVCALYDTAKSNLRLYCIRFGKVAIVLGNGGHKPKTIRALQENKRLAETNTTVRKVSKLIDQRIREKEIWWDGNQLRGNLIFKFDDEDEE